MEIQWLANRKNCDLLNAIIYVVDGGRNIKVVFIKGTRHIFPFIVSQYSNLDDA